MSSSNLILKNPRGWFAAGTEVSQAMMILSDGAFKLFLYICLNARRDSGALDTTQTELARSLTKAPGTIRRCLSEMEKAGICQNRFGHNPTGQGTIQITESYWPYRRGETQTAAAEAADTYVAEIRKMLDARACVRPLFSTADEILARDWFRRGISLELIQQAILMGCGRKYISWRNNQTHAPISSLKYFESILDEIERQTISPDYWDYIRFRLQRVEKLWIESFGKKGIVEQQTVTAASR